MHSKQHFLLDVNTQNSYTVIQLLQFWTDINYPRTYTPHSDLHNCCLIAGQILDRPHTLDHQSNRTFTLPEDVASAGPNSTALVRRDGQIRPNTSLLSHGDLGISASNRPPSSTETQRHDAHSDRYHRLLSQLPLPRTLRSEHLAPNLRASQRTRGRVPATVQVAARGETQSRRYKRRAGRKGQAEFARQGLDGK